MKKYLCTLAVVGLAASAFAQGQINFTSGSALVKDPAGVSAAVNSGFVELFWAPTGTAIASAWNPAAPVTATAWLTANPGWAALPATIKAINGPIAGRFSAGVTDIPTATPGAVIDAVAAAWQGNYTSFDAAFAAGGVGAFSSKFTVDTANPNATPVAEIPTTTSGLFPGISMVPLGVPEPSSLALAGLGAAALLIFRRRK